MADFMLGLPRTVIPPTDQIQGHVGGWRNGFFINDNWQARRNLTLSLGLRYERSTPVQTYAGVADMLAEDFLTIIPSPNLSAYPVKGFKFTEPNNKDFAPRLGATYRLSEKTVVRAGYGIYYNPNQMNSFTFLTNNPPLAVVSTYTSRSGQPDVVVRASRPACAAPPVSARHDFADAASSERAQGSVELRRSAGALGEWWRSISSTWAPTRAISIAASSTTRRRRALARSIHVGRRRCSGAAASSRTI